MHMQASPTYPVSKIVAAQRLPTKTQTFGNLLISTSGAHSIIAPRRKLAHTCLMKDEALALHLVSVVAKACNSALKSETLRLDSAGGRASCLPFSSRRTALFRLSIASRSSELYTRSPLFFA